MRAAIYPRVSTDEQFKEGYSIDSQKDNCLNFIRSQGWELHDIYTEEGYSAKNLNRPSIQRLIQDAKQQKFDVVVFYKLDRLVRSVSDLDKLLKLFDANNIGIRSVTEPFDTTTAIGRFLITLVAAIAQWERETISERVVLNMEKKATLGERNGGRAPFGYNLVEGNLAINEGEAKFVRDMFRLYINGKGIRSIALYLNQFGIDKDLRTIGRMLDNPVYCGKLRWANKSRLETVVTENTHPAIIDDDTFDKVQQLREQRTMEGKKATSPYHFSGVLKCARCGSPLSGYYKKERGTKHYICINKKNKGACNLPQFTEKALTVRFLEELSPDNPERFFSLANEFNIDSQEEVDHEHLVKELEKELASIKNRKKNWLMALGNGVMSQEEYLALSEEDTKKEKLLKDQLEQMNIGKCSINKDDVIKMLTVLSNSWDKTNDYEKKSFINDLFESITVDVPKEYVRGRGKTPSVIIKGVSLR